MKCIDFQEKVNAYIDGEFINDVEAFEEHLNTCETCRSEYEDLLELKSLMSDMPILDLPEGFEESLHDKLVQEQKPVSFIKRYNTQIKWVGSLAAVAIVAITLVNNGLNSTVYEADDMAAPEAYSAERIMSDEVSNQPKGILESSKAAEDVIVTFTSKDSEDMDVDVVAADAVDTYSVSIQFNESIRANATTDGRTYIVSNTADEVDDVLKAFKVKDLEYVDDRYKFYVSKDDADALLSEILSTLNVEEHYGEYYGNVIEKQETLIEDQRAIIEELEKNETLNSSTQKAIIADERKALETYEEDLETLKENEGYEYITIIIIKE